MMQYYPVNLDIRDRSCLVVGGGRVGERKASRLIRCGARVTLVSREATERLGQMQSEGKIVLHRRDYRETDLDGVFLVFCATDNAELNRKIGEAAERRGLLCNIADSPHRSAFVLPSVVERGDLVLTVSTSGRSPAFAKALRKDLEARFGMEYATFLKLMGAIRKRLLDRDHDPEAHHRLFRRLIDGELLERVREGDKSGINALLSEVLGADLTYDKLLDDSDHKI